MNISRYIFDSPYPNQMQIGRPDPSVKQDASSKQQSSQLLQNSNTTVTKAETFLSTLKQDVKPTVSPTKLLDTYA